MAMTKTEKMELDSRFPKLPAAAREMPAKDPRDEVLESMIEKAVPDLSKDIRIIVRSGFATLSGHVGDRFAKLKLAERLKTIPGIKDVTNHLHIVAEEED